MCVGTGALAATIHVFALINISAGYLIHIKFISFRASAAVGTRCVHTGLCTEGRVFSTFIHIFTSGTIGRQTVSNVLITCTPVAPFSVDTASRCGSTLTACIDPFTALINICA
jgi:hypothetical protein